MSKGMQSTEFWLLAVGLAAILFQGPLGLTVPGDVQEWIIGALIAYTGGRSGVKAVAENARKKVNVEYRKED